VSMVCMHAISSLLEKDKAQRIGASSWNSFTDNPFFRPVDFDALERKEIEPIFKPSSEKTNFDATYDLEELLLEEAPLEARTRKQKPRPELRADATEAEIRADELHRMIETMFEPFNYLTVPETRSGSTSSTHQSDPTRLMHPRNPVALEGASPTVTKSDSNDSHTPQDLQKVRSIPTPHASTPNNVSRTRSSTQSPNGSPPLHTNQVQNTSPAQSEYFAQQQQRLPRSERYDAPPPPLPPTSHPQQAVNKAHRPRGSTRSTSMSGGVQVVLNETGSWSEMANQSQGLVQPQEERKPAGMLGFLSRKKGRDRSPKAKERERGVLGKEGARVVVGS
jgi:serine/threonine kinase 32